MRAVMLSISERELRERQARGIDRWDEIWEGELHMPPAPSYGHQDTATTLAVFLRRSWGESGHVVIQAGLCDPAAPDTNYRIPDVMFVLAGHEEVIKERGVVGAADAVIEVRSPGDETYEKFDFFAALGVREVVVIDRDTKKPEVYRLAGRKYVGIAPSAEGWVTAEVMRVRFRPGERLRAEALDDPGVAVEI